MNLWKLTAIASLVISGSALAQYTGAPVTTGGNTDLSSTVGLANTATGAHGSELPSWLPDGSNGGQTVKVGSEHVAIYQQNSNNTATVGQTEAAGSSTLIYQSGNQNSINTLQTAKQSLIFVKQSGGPHNTIGTGGPNALTQSGYNNRLVINQELDNNHVNSPGQSGFNNTAVIYQRGDNTVNLNLSGNNNGTFSSQVGSNNTGNLTQSGSYNDMLLKQNGANNLANVTQSGGSLFLGGNDISVKQSYGNNATVTQSGFSNDADVTQNTNNNATVTQTGFFNAGNDVIVTQNLGNTATVTQSGLGNDTTVTQGSNNTATVNQAGTNNSVSVSQPQSFGKATVDQGALTSNNTVTTSQTDWYGQIEVAQNGFTHDSDVKITQNSPSWNNTSYQGNSDIGVSTAKVVQNSASNSDVTINQMTTASNVFTAATAYVQQAGFNNSATITQK